MARPLLGVDIAVPGQVCGSVARRLTARSGV